MISHPLYTQILLVMYMQSLFVHVNMNPHSLIFFFFFLNIPAPPEFSPFPHHAPFPFFVKFGAREPADRPPARLPRDAGGGGGGRRFHGRPRPDEAGAQVRGSGAAVRAVRPGARAAAGTAAGSVAGGAGGARAGERSADPREQPPRGEHAPHGARAGRGVGGASRSGEDT